MRVVFGVGQPEELAIARAKFGERRREGETRLGLAGEIARGGTLRRQILERNGALAPPVIAEQVGADAKEIAAGCDLAIQWRRASVAGSRGVGGMASGIAARLHSFGCLDS